VIQNFQGKLRSKPNIGRLRSVALLSMRISRSTSLCVVQARNGLPSRSDPE
jgi:hypothetical protein